MKAYYRETQDQEITRAKWLILCVVAVTLVASGFGFIQLLCMIAERV